MAKTVPVIARQAMAWGGRSYPTGATVILPIVDALTLKRRGVVSLTRKAPSATIPPPPPEPEPAETMRRRRYRRRDLQAEDTSPSGAAAPAPAAVVEPPAPPPDQDT
jgi:hypothetical protein